MSVLGEVGPGTVHVTVEDEDGVSETQIVPAGDYVITCVEPCHVSYVAAYANGTHVLTIKGRKAGL